LLSTRQTAREIANLPGPRPVTREGRAVQTALSGPGSRWNVALADVCFEAHYGLK